MEALDEREAGNLRACGTNVLTGSYRASAEVPSLRGAEEVLSGWDIRLFEKKKRKGLFQERITRKCNLSFGQFFTMKYHNHQILSKCEVPDERV
jgi:hypothetical protein